MADTGWVIAGTGTSALGEAIGSWSTPNAITTETTETAAYALNALPDAMNSDLLHATNFGFLIPNEAEIKGIEARISASGAGGTCSDNVVQVLSGGVAAGQNKATRTWTSSYTTYDYGSSLDMWGLSLTPAQINATNFGLVFQAKVAGKGSFQVSSIWMRIHYEESGNFFERVAGTWRKGQLSERVAGVHRSGPLFQRISGVWRS